MTQRLRITSRNSGKFCLKNVSACRRALSLAGRCGSGLSSSTVARDSSEASFSAIMRRNLSDRFRGVQARKHSTLTRQSTRLGWASGNSSEALADASGITRHPAYSSPWGIRARLKRVRQHHSERVNLNATEVVPNQYNRRQELAIRDYLGFIDVVPEPRIGAEHSASLRDTFARNPPDPCARAGLAHLSRGQSRHPLIAVSRRISHRRAPEAAPRLHVLRSHKFLQEPASALKSGRLSITSGHSGLRLRSPL